MGGGTPYVTVCVPTYNHEKYITRAIDSILVQRCQYQVQILISDDCSTDKTGQIVSEMEHSYPDIIKVLHHSGNIGMHDNLNELLLAAKSKYVAKLEGDDYWTDERKLQKQISFLDENDDFVTCAHNVHIVDENEVIRVDMPDHYWDNYVFTLDDYLGGHEVLGGHTASQVYRNIFKDMGKRRLSLFCNSWINEDQRLNLFLAIEGKKMIFSDYMANWMVTRQGNNWTNRISSEPFKFEKYRIDSYHELENLAQEAYGIALDLGNGMADVYLQMIKSFLRHPSREKLSVLYGYREKVPFSSIINEMTYKVKKKIKNT